MKGADALCSPLIGKLVFFKFKGFLPLPFFQIDEDDPAKFKQSVHILTMKLFADLERRRRQLEQKVSDEAARKRESEIEAEERKNVEKEFAKNWEESRQGKIRFFF